MKKREKNNEITLIRVKRNHQITLPGKLRKKYNIIEGDYLDIEQTEKGILIKPVKVVRPDQEYFYTKEWQKDEYVADENIEKDELEGPFDNADDLIKSLDS